MQRGVCRRRLRPGKAAQGAGPVVLLGPHAHGRSGASVFLSVSLQQSATILTNAHHCATQALYSPIPDRGHVFFFRDGTLVCWRGTDAQIERCLFDSRMAQINPLPASLQETEEMNFVDDVNLAYVR